MFELVLQINSTTFLNRKIIIISLIKNYESIGNSYKNFWPELNF